MSRVLCKYVNGEAQHADHVHGGDLAHADSQMIIAVPHSQVTASPPPARSALPRRLAPGHRQEPRVRPDRACGAGDRGRASCGLSAAERGLELDDGLAQASPRRLSSMAFPAPLPPSATASTTTAQTQNSPTATIRPGAVTRPGPARHLEITSTIPRAPQFTATTSVRPRTTRLRATTVTGSAPGT